MLQAPSYDQALEYIRQCLAYFWRNWQTPQPHLPNLSWQLLGETEPEAIVKVIKQAADNEFSELNKTATARCFPELAQDIIQKLSTSEEGEVSWNQDYQWIWQPVLDAVQENDKTPKEGQAK